METRPFNPAEPKTLPTVAASGTTGASPSRLAPIDFLRTVSIFVVLAVHWHGSQQGAWPSSEYVTNIWNHLVRNGSFGVTIFFVVSGFLISRMIHQSYGSWGAIRLKHFYLRRAARILPLLALTIVVGAMFVQWGSALPGYQFTMKSGVPMDGTFMASIGLFFFNLLRAARDTGFGLNWDAFWSLAIEEQFYLIYPATLLLLRKNLRILGVLLAVMAIGPAYRVWAYSDSNGSWLRTFTHSLACFEQLAIGCLTFLISRRFDEKLSRLGFVNLAVSLVAFAAIFAVYWYYPMHDRTGMVWGATLIAYPAGLFILCARHSTFYDTGFMRALSWPGKFSYGLYLGHSATMLVGWSFFGSFSKFPGLFLYFGFTTVVAAALFRFFEQPCAKWITSRGTKASAARPLALPGPGSPQPQPEKRVA